MNDWQLIEAYARERSEGAFETLVKRHLDLVYSVALRQVRNPALAEDVTQAVFLLLARKSADLRREVVLTGWLFRTTRFIAARALRAEFRRQRREQEAAVMTPTTFDPQSNETTWQQVEPFLDQAVADLSAVDRDALLLRFYRRLPLSEVGAQLGVSEEAAKKRVRRAVGPHSVAQAGLALGAGRFGDPSHSFSAPGSHCPTTAGTVCVCCRRASACPARISTHRRCGRERPADRGNRCARRLVEARSTESARAVEDRCFWKGRV